MSNLTPTRTRTARAADGALRLQTRLRWEQIVQSERPASIKLALLATFTINPLVPYLGVALDEQGIAADIWIGPYHQILAQCLHQDSETAQYGPDILVIFPRLEELWGGQPLPLTDDPGAYLANVTELAAATLAAARRYAATLVFVLPAIPEARPLGVGDAGTIRGVFACATAAREALRQHLAGQPDVLLLDAEAIVRTVGSTQAYNQRMQAVARIPFSEQVFWLIGQDLARLITLQRQPVPRVIAVDADNVLWGGNLATLGAAGVDLHEGGPGELYRQIQAFLLELRRTGIQIALCGNYVPDDLWAVLNRRDMRLKQEHLAGWQLGTQPLETALRQLAATLSVELHGLVLLTQNPDAASAVQSAAPEVASIVLPEDPAEWLTVIQGAGLLDQLPPVDQRPLTTDQQDLLADRPLLSLQDFLARLNLEVQLFPIEASQIEHVAHLTEHTSDFHLTGMPQSAADIADFLADDRAEGRVIEVRDRLGDYGIAGVVLFSIAAGVLDVAAFVLNCRVLGRNVEQIVLTQLAMIAQERGCSYVRLTYRRTARNRVAAEFVQAIVGGTLEQHADGFSMTVPVANLTTPATSDQLSSCAIEPQPATLLGSTLAPTNGKGVPGAAIELLTRRWQAMPAETRAELLTRIATDFRSGTRILEAVRHQRRRSRPDLADSFVPPRTALEGQLAEIWAQVLGVERVGVCDNFFHLGGHSILATQLVMQLYNVLGIELPVRIFFETPTIESMAQAIDIIRRTGDDSAFTADAPTYIKAEPILDATIVPGDTPPVMHTTDPRTIFLTGATGFLGAFLLAELLQRTRATILCLVRANGVDDGLARIRNNLAHYGLWQERFGSRVIPIMGDLGQPLLGLGESQFQALADDIDVIYHAGAITSFIYPYSTLKPANVLGTQEVLRLASRVRLKPVHFISTLYVFAPADRPADRPIREDDLPQHVDTMHIGYRQSKWVAEQLVLIARERGLPVVVYRPSRIAGHSVTGACQTNDFVWRMIRACIEVNSVMSYEMLMDMVPVDYVSQAVVEFSLRPDACGKVFHLVSARPPMLGDIIAWAHMYGYALQREPYPLWRSRLKEAAERSHQSAAYAMVPFLPEALTEAELTDLAFDQHNTIAGLTGSHVQCPTINSTLFQRYLDYFIESGFLPAPDGRWVAQPAISASSTRKMG